MGDIVSFSVAVKNAKDPSSAYRRAFMSEYPFPDKWREEGRNDVVRLQARKIAKEIWRTQNAMIRAAWESGVEPWEDLVGIPDFVTVSQRRGFVIVTFDVEV